MQKDIRAELADNVPYAYNVWKREKTLKIISMVSKMLKKKKKDISVFGFSGNSLWVCR